MFTMRTGICFYPYPKRQILDASKLTEFADNNFKLDEMAESSHFEQFLLFPQSFQKTSTADT